MKIVKKLTAVLLAIAMFALTACSSGPDVTALSETYSKLQTEYNDMIAKLSANEEFANDTDFMNNMNSIADKINACASVIGDPGDRTQEQIDQLTADLENLRDWVASSGELLGLN